jgi:shikimate dehydrogenase
MKLALLGFPIAHSLSPMLYRELLGVELESYELLEINSPSKIPSLEDLSARLQGMNITSPYKTHFLGEVTLDNEVVRKIGAINTISFTPEGAIATNTDVLAVETLLVKYRPRTILLLGDGTMAKMTKIVAENLSIPLTQLSRRTHPDFASFDLGGAQAGRLVINACSRDFVFKGRLTPSDEFWDFNYSFSPHERTIPSQVKKYYDGQEMLRLQAEAAVAFWKRTNPKLNR